MSAFLKLDILHTFKAVAPASDGPEDSAGGSMSLTALYPIALNNHGSLTETRRRVTERNTQEIVALSYPTKT